MLGSSAAMNSAIALDSSLLAHAGQRPRNEDVSGCFSPHSLHFPVIALVTMSSQRDNIRGSRGYNQISLAGNDMV